MSVSSRIRTAMISATASCAALGSGTEPPSAADPIGGAAAGPPSGLWRGRVPLPDIGSSVCCHPPDSKRAS
jgi:hypothetical protein